MFNDKILPMKKVSTSCTTDLSVKRNNMVSCSVENGPEQKTLDFLKRFARSYHAEPSLEARLCDFILN